MGSFVSVGRCKEITCSDVTLDELLLKAHSLHVAEVSLISRLEPFVVSRGHMVCVAVEQLSMHLHKVSEVCGTHYY